jgi:hypothetical protein
MTQKSTAVIGLSSKTSEWIVVTNSNEEQSSFESQTASAEKFVALESDDIELAVEAAEPTVGSERVGKTPSGTWP